MRPLIVGEAPSRTSDPRRPIGGRCGARLAAFCGLDDRTFALTFARANLLDAWPGASGGKGAAFPIADARLAARRLARRFRGRRVVVLLGLRVARAFGIRARYLEERRVSGARVIVLPHPSGVNRWYNDASNVDAARDALRRVVRDYWREP